MALSTVRNTFVSVPSILSVAPTSVSKEEVENRTKNYCRFFNDGDVQERKENSFNITMTYYDLVTNFYEYGWGQSFHFASRYVGESFEMSILRHEIMLAQQIGMQPGKKYLDIGCGVGGPQRNIARFYPKSNIIGLNINKYQISRAQRHTESACLQDTCSYLEGSFMEIPLPDNDLDGGYSIEATCHAGDKLGAYKEILRVMKPGTYFANYEWAMTNMYDPDNKEHCRIKKGIEIGNALPDIDTIDTIRSLYEQAGFEVIMVKDCVRNEEGMIPWYATLQGSYSLNNFRHTTLGRWLTHKMITNLEYFGFAPKGTAAVHDVLLTAAGTLVEGGITGIFTPMAMFVVRKP